MTDKSLRIVFMGTPDFSVAALQILIDSPHEVVCVYTQPPRPKGRGKQVQKSPVHDVALKAGIEVRTPKFLKKNEEEWAYLRSLEADVAVVAAYGLILPEAVLDAPKYGCLNIHASLLPRWRGAAPIQYAILAGDDKSGVTIMQMDEGLDTGPMVIKGEIPITSETTASSLHDALSDIGAVLIVEALDILSRKGKLPVMSQEDDLSTYASMLSRDDGRIDWNEEAGIIERKARALTPWPGIWCETHQNKRLKIHKTALTKQTTKAPPGTLLDKLGHVACGHGTVLKLLEIQPANAKSMDFTGAVNGNYLKVDDLLL